MKRSSKEQVDTSNATQVPRSDYVDTLRKIQKEGLCPFCEEHLLKFHTKPILHKGRHWLVTFNAWPYEGSREHFLLIARKHVESMEELSPHAWSELHKHIKTLSKEHGMKGATLLLRSGETKLTGASVRHLHAQIILGKTRNARSTPITAIVGFK